MANVGPTPDVIRVFMASPADVAPEREILERRIRELNDAADAFDAQLTIELEAWEKLCPAAGRGARGAQKVIDKEIGPYDIFVGMMWRRFGPGTEHEYKMAYRSWKKHKKPQIMFYFSTAAAPQPDTVEEAEQVMKVAEFRRKMTVHSLVRKYDGTRDFDTVIWPHLLDVLKRLQKQRRRHDRVLDRGKRGMFEAVSIAAAPRKGNGKEEGQWRKQARSRSQSRKRPPQRRSS